MGSLFDATAGCENQTGIDVARFDGATASYRTLDSLSEVEICGFARGWRRLVWRHMPREN